MKYMVDVLLSTFKYLVFSEVVVDSTISSWIETINLLSSNPYVLTTSSSDSMREASEKIFNEIYSIIFYSILLF